MSKRTMPCKNTDIDTFVSDHPNLRPDTENGAYVPEVSQEMRQLNEAIIAQAVQTSNR